MEQRPRCHDTRHCWAKERGFCKILNQTYADNECPFRKEENNVSKSAQLTINSQQ